MGFALQAQATPLRENSLSVLESTIFSNLNGSDSNQPVEQGLGA